MVRRLMVALVAGAMMQMSGMQILAADSSDARQWLMMVRTVNTAPTKEREFNAWYDDIDIPDVLKVPGYWRAARGGKKALSGPSLPPTARTPGKEALTWPYDIDARAND